MTRRSVTYIPDGSESNMFACPSGCHLISGASSESADYFSVIVWDSKMNYIVVKGLSVPNIWGSSADYRLHEVRGVEGGWGYDQLPPGRVSTRSAEA